MSTKKDYSRLFERASIGNVTFRNRIGMPPMGTMQEAADGLLTDSHVAYFAARAKGGCGFIILEGQQVTNKTDPWNSGFTTADTDEQAKKWAEVIEICHAYGSKVCVQLCCGQGRNAFVFDDKVTPPVSSSAIPSFYNPNKLCRPLEKEEIQDIVTRYGRCAFRAVRAGADMIEIHAHAGYLIDQFMSPQWNKRTDEYGGTFENGMRFIKEIYESIRKNVGPKVPILVRMAMTHDYEGGRTLESSVPIVQ